MFNKYPYTDFHEINLDWILAEIKRLHHNIDEFTALNKITFAGNWNIAEQYPAWCIVNTEGGTLGYISIQPVPAGVTINNTDYWAAIVDYTAVIGDLHNRVVALENHQGNLNNLITKDKSTLVNAINDSIHMCKDKAYIFISDSYGARAYSWIDAAINAMGLTLGVNAYKSSVGGAGFHFGYDFKKQLNDITVSDPSTITDIIVGGGFNDRGQNPSDVTDSIEDFINTANASYPNAKVHIAFIGWSFNSEFVSELQQNNVLLTYKEACKLGAVYVDHSDEIMHNTSLYLQEPQSPYNLLLGYMYVHPNDAGSDAIGACIAGHLMGGGASYDGSCVIAPTLDGTYTVQNGDMNLHMSKHNDSIYVNKNNDHLTVLKFASNVSLNGTYIDLGLVESGMISGPRTGIPAYTEYISPSIPVYGFCPASGGVNRSFSGSLVFLNNHLYLHAYNNEIAPQQYIGIYGYGGVLTTNTI